MTDEIEECAKMLAQLWAKQRDYPFWGNETVRFRKVVEGLISDDGAAMTAEQYQIGDRVIYTPEGVVTTVSGYLWFNTVEKRPSIMGYELACGITVGSGLICRAPPASGGFVHFFNPPHSEVDASRINRALKVKGVR
jgi:hypothetical protein